MADTPPKICSHCGTAGAMRICGGCGTTRYCDKVCQQGHWHAEHRQSCVGRKEKVKKAGGTGAGAGAGDGAGARTQQPRFDSSNVRAAAKKKTTKKKKIIIQTNAACTDDSARAYASGGGGGGGGGASSSVKPSDPTAMGDAGARRPRQCGHCGVLESGDTHLKQCAQCKQVAYCSPAHQKEHWNHGGHKGECTAPTPLSALEKVPALFASGMCAFDICEQLAGSGYIDSVAGKRGKPLCLVELPMVEKDLDLRHYRVPRKGRGSKDEHETPYFKRKDGGGGWIVLANLLDDAGIGMRMCLNLSDNLWHATKFRECKLLGERMLAAVEPHLLATEIQVQCCQIKGSTRGEAFVFFYEVRYIGIYVYDVCARACV